MEGVKRNLRWSLDNTPVLKGKSRKRKSYYNDVCSSYSSESSDYVSCTEYDDVSFNAEDIKASSPAIAAQDDAKLTSSLEKCTLLDFEGSKRVKLDYDTSPIARRKSNSAPNTPQRDQESDTSIKKCRSLELSPIKSFQWAKIHSLGTPERTQILYPFLTEKLPPSKPKSPAKLRQELGCRGFRKRLFVCRDFVQLFTRNSSNGDIVRKIFGYLSGGDLANVVRVSGTWRRAVREDKYAYERYRTYQKHVLTGKENILGQRQSFGHGSSFGKKNSPDKENTPQILDVVTKWHKYTQVCYLHS